MLMSVIITLLLNVIIIKSYCGLAKKKIAPFLTEMPSSRGESSRHKVWKHFKPILSQMNWKERLKGSRFLVYQIETLRD